MLYDELVAQNLTHLAEHEPSYDLLISPEFLYSLIFNPIASIATTNRIANLTQTTAALVTPMPNYKLFEVSNVDENQFYMISHIPTSVHLSTNEIEEPQLWNRKNRSKLIELVAELGIKENNTELIIFYGNPDPMAAYRAAVIFKWIGVNNVRILNGGYKSWLRRNFPIEKKYNKRIPCEKAENYFNNKIDNEKSTYIVDLEFMQDLVKNFNTFCNEYCIIDVRSWKEFCGEISGYEGFLLMGRIPFSIWGKAGTSAYQLEDYRNFDLTMKPALEIFKMWQELGIDYNRKHLIFYCGTGWRAAECVIYAEVIGLTKVSLYDGGWFEWSSFPENKIEKGTLLNS
jgi:thiosulfate/3-mercaptopyruvate sulfurtransferase